MRGRRGGLWDRARARARARARDRVGVGLGVGWGYGGWVGWRVWGLRVWGLGGVEGKDRGREVEGR